LSGRFRCCRKKANNLPTELVEVALAKIGEAKDQHQLRMLRANIIYEALPNLLLNMAVAK